MDVVVVGAGIAGLTVARDLAAPGRSVSVLDSAGYAGGSVAALDVAGLRVDAGADSFATRSPAVTQLLSELGLGGDVVLPRGGAWLELPRGPVRAPRTGMLGIPGSPWAGDVRAAVGVLGSLRASADRWLPPGVGRGPGTTSLGRLVRVRQGRRVLDRLVTPVVAGVHAALPDDVDVDTVLPGLRPAMAEHGSLGAAVTALRAAAPAGSAVAGLRGGMHRLATALSDDLGRRGVAVRTGVRVTGLVRSGDRWRLDVLVDDADGVPAAEAVHAEHVVLAVPGPVALGLLGPVLPAASAPGPEAETGVVLVTLVVDAPVLDGAPRGTGVLVAPGVEGVRAKALTHASAKWEWLAEAAGPGRHVLRLSYGGPGRSTVPADDAVAVAVADAARLLDVPIAPEQVVGSARTQWSGGLPRVRPGHQDRVLAVRAALEELPGLWACGAWLAGTGLVSVVTDARRVASRIHHEVTQE